MKTSCLLQISVFFFLVLAACEKKESVKNNEALAEKNLNQNAPVKSPIAKITDVNQDLINDMHDVQKRLGKGTELDWANLMASYWASSWTSTFSTSSLNSVQELINANNYEQLLGKVAQHDLGNLADDEAECLSKWFAASLISSNSSADSLPNAFAALSDTSKPTKGDLILYVLFRDAYANKAFRSALNSKQKEKWRKMSESPNPVVRLIAAETYLHVEEDVSDWLDYYSSFKNDADPYILEKVISILYTSGKVEAIAVLEEFNECETVKGNPQLKQMIASRIYSLQKNADQE